MCLRLGIYHSSLPLNKKIYHKRSVTGTGRLWLRSTHGWPNRCGEVTRPQRPFRFIYLFRSPQEQSAGLPCFELAVYSVTQMRKPLRGYFLQDQYQLYTHNIYTITPNLQNRVNFIAWGLFL